MTYTIELHGEIVAKKNHLMPVKRKNGKLGLINSRKSKTSMDYLAFQIPGNVRDLNLIHPDLDFYQTVPDGRTDSDNALTTIIDLLKEYRIIKNDSIAQFNGRKTIHPAVMSDHWKTVIVLTTQEGRESEDFRPLLSTE